MKDVTLITTCASLDSLSSQDYRDMFDELRPPDAKGKRLSLDKFIERVGSQYSKAQWGQYDNGEKGLTRQMRNELRAAMGMVLLPPTVADAVAAHTSPDASVWADGDGVAHHVILVTRTEPQTFHVNGVVTLLDMAQGDARNAAGPPQDDMQSKRTRRPTKRYTWADTQEERRAKLGVDPQDVINAGLDALERGNY